MSNSSELVERHRLEKVWEKYVYKEKNDLQDVKSVIASSWYRCSLASVSPTGGVCSLIRDDDTMQRLVASNRLLINSAVPVLESIYHSIHGSGFMMVLVSKEGIVLKSMGDNKALTSAERINFYRGADWTENSVGTNAIGTCLATGMPVQVTGAEHFCSTHHSWTCSAAPIHDTAGNIIGCLDISGPFEKIHPHTLGIMVAASKTVESLLHRTPPPESTNRIYGGWEEKKLGNQPAVVAKPGGNPALYSFADIIGKSRQIHTAIKLAQKAVSHSFTVLLTGESGTGKELFAQAIHNAGSCSNRPFIPVNCASMPEGLIQSELFGYSDGAFTGARRGGQPGKFEMANGGTLFLDEIGDMPVDMQANLLRVLQDKTVVRVGGNKPIPTNARIIAATNKDLFKEVQEGNFREDLFYRINVLSIEIPPLRKREGDLNLLIDYFLAKISNKIGKKVNSIEPDVMDILHHYRWPGNVRELANVLEQALIITEENIIRTCHLPGYILATYNCSEENKWQPKTLTQMEKTMIKEALSRLNGNISKTARMLGIGRNTLYEKMKKHNIKV